MALLNGLKTPQDLPFPGIASSNVGFFYFEVPKPNKTLPSGLCSQRGERQPQGTEDNMQAVGFQ